MQPLGIVMLLTNRWPEADPPRESEAWWLDRARRERRSATVTPLRRERRSATVTPLRRERRSPTVFSVRRAPDPDDRERWIGSERWVG